MKKKIKYLQQYLPKDLLDESLRQLEMGVPVQYIVGNVDFMGYTINVDKRVLIPRFETELLVDKVIGYTKKIFDNCYNLKILDIGTGSGCIAVALKKELNCKVVGIDISDEALEVAKYNAKCNNVDIEFFRSDIFSNVCDSYDVIISNPPYISVDEEIDDVVKNNEPYGALYAADNGLYFYDKILQNCANYLSSNYLIAFEIGEKQALDIEKLAYKYLGDVLVKVEKDYSERERFIFIQNK